MLQKLKSFLILYLPLAILTAFSIYFIAGYILISFSRMNIEWNIGPFEDASLRAVLKILNNEPLYSRAALDYIPLIYAPLYFKLASISLYIFGVSFASLRIPSILSMLIAPVIFYYISAVFFINKSQKYFSAFLISGILFSIYFSTGLWFDLAKVDALFILFTSLTVLFLFKSLRENSAVSFIFLIIFASSLIFIKQTGIVFTGISALSFLYFRDIKRFFIFSSASGSIILMIYFLYALMPDENLFFYTVNVPSKHAFINFNFLSEIKVIISALFISPLVFAVTRHSYFAEKLYSSSGKKEDHTVKFLIIMIAMSAAALFIGITGRMKYGGVSNSFIYTVIFLSMFSGIYLTENIFQTLMGIKRNHLTKLQAVIFFILFIFTALHFKMNFYYFPYVIKDFSRKKALVSSLKKNLCELEYPGLFLSDATYLQSYYCKQKANFAYITVMDIVPLESEFSRIVTSLESSLKNHEFKFILMDKKTYIPREEINTALAYINKRLTENISSAEINHLKSFKNALLLNLTLNEHYRPSDELTPAEKNYADLNMEYDGSHIVFLK